MANQARGQTTQDQPKPLGTELEIILPNGKRFKAEQFPERR